MFQSPVCDYSSRRKKKNKATSRSRHCAPERICQERRKKICQENTSKLYPDEDIYVSLCKSETGSSSDRNWYFLHDMATSEQESLL